MVRASLVIVAVAAAVLLPATACWACSCAPAEPDEHYGWADAVFDGTVVDRSGPDGNGMITWTFDVVDVWKGDVADQQELESHEHGATCGFTFEPGVEYRVFASTASGVMSTNLCSGTAPRDHFDSGPPVAPSESAPPTKTPAPEPSATQSGDPVQPPPVTSTGASASDPKPDASSADPSVTPSPVVVGTLGPGDGVDVVPAGSSSAGLVIGAAAGGVGLVGLAVWLLRRDGPTGPVA